MAHISTARELELFTPGDTRITAEVCLPHLLAGLHGLVAGRDDEIALADAGDGGGLIVARKLLHGDAGGDIAAAERRILRLQDIDEFAVGVLAQAGERDERVVIRALLADGERDVLAGLHVAREREDERALGLTTLVGLLVLGLHLPHSHQAQSGYNQHSFHSFFTLIG